MPKRSLQTGVAYHGNRMLSYARQDMRNIAKADMDIVVHMLSHTDLDRHKAVIKDIISASYDEGLEVWVDNWGLGGPPGDKSHFLSYYPDSHMYLSDGSMLPVNVCLNSPDFRDFVKKWIDSVYEIGGRKIFWDEPYIPVRKDSSGNLLYGCSCPRCKKLFEEKYGRPMPLFLDSDVEDFRTETIIDYFSEITSYSASLGIENIVCVMLGQNLGINLDTLDRICSLPSMHNVGSDPYWYGKKDVNPYEFVYNGTKKNLDIATKFNKGHNIWIQGFGVPKGREEEIIEATAAAYDAGARCILSWGYNGSESNTYRSENPLRVWDITVEAMRRIRNMERDRILEENRRRYRK